MADVPPADSRSWPHRVAERLRANLPYPTRSDWIFALRTVAAAFAALVVAYALRMERPQWAMMTVFIVAQPVAGMVLAKGFFRLLGTIVGAGVSLAMVPAFGGHPWLFVTVLSLWIGLCTLVASMLRNPEAYGAALSGYTATIIALPALDQPHLVYELATARCTEIALGIVCAGISSRLILPQLAGEAMAARLRRCIIDLATYTRQTFSGAEQEQLDASYRKLIADVQALGEMRTYARLEAPSQATRAHSVRRSIGNLLWALSTARLVYRHAVPNSPVLLPIRAELHTVVKGLSEQPDALDDTGPWIARLNAISADVHEARDHASETPDRIHTASRLTLAAELAQALKELLRGYDALVSPRQKPMRARRQPAFVIHRDRTMAVRNAVRACVATLLVSAFWLTTQWVELTGVVVLVAVVTSLFAALPAPVAAATSFLKGTVLALPFAFLIGQVILPSFPGFGWFVAFLVPVLLPATLGMANPRTTKTATAFVINFIVFLGPRPVMIWEPARFAVEAASVVIGIALAIGVFMVVLPPDPAGRIADIARAMRETLVRLCIHARVPRRSVFEGLAYDRINELMSLSQQTGKTVTPLFAGSVASVTVGLEILRLRRMQRSADAATARSIEAFLHGLARDLLVSQSGKPLAASIAGARREAVEIAEAGTPDALQVAASMRIIAAAVEDHPAFFRGGAG
ncbi:MAG: FUSC family protein [Rhizobiales bacterium]|nr:FUSC family protein [Hyphomicrobiales bacterium]